MFIVFGTMGMKSTVGEEAPLHNSCPNCSKDLIMKKYRRWFTLFFIPIFPFETLDTYYECNHCKSAYALKIKKALEQNSSNREIAIREAKVVYAKTLIATMTHMAMIDGDFAPEEAQFIEGTIAQFTEYETEVKATYEHVKRNGNNENFVFDLLNTAREILSTEGLLTILAQSAKVLLADGKIEKGEENLMKEYLVACGLPKEMYKTLLDKLKQPVILPN